MKKTAKCPKCGSASIYTNAGLTKTGERQSLSVGFFRRIVTDAYVCTQCGYLEEYITAKTLQNTSLMDKLRSIWRSAH